MTAVSKTRATLSAGFEVVASIVLVLLCFVAFTAILFSSFPAGSELGDLFASVGMSTDNGGGTVRLEASGRGAWRDLVASLSTVKRSVKSKPADSIAWTDARPGLPLASRDAVQTFQRSVATISFDSPNELRLGENSLVVVRNSEQEPETNARRATVVLMNGELRGAIASKGRRPMDMQVAVGVATARVVSPERRPARFRIAAWANRASIVSVFDGTAAVTSPKGSVSLPPNTYVAVDAEGRIDGPRPLPAIPEPIEPRSEEIRHARAGKAEVRFAWSQREQPAASHLVVAIDPKFEELVYDGFPPASELVLGHLNNGRYYWRVSAERNGAESDFSPPRWFELKSDGHPPALHVNFPDTVAAEATVIVSGTTDPGVSVYIAGKSVPVDAHGRFEAPVDLQQGINLLVVEAVDASGNVAYASQMVTGKFGVTKRPS